MKRLPIERAYQLESIPCPRCSGTGRSPRGRGRDSAYLPSECYNCKSLGWKPTPAGRDLFYEILELLGVKVKHRPTRIDPYLIPSLRLQANQLDAIDKLMAARVGNGAIIVSDETIKHANR